METSPSPRWKRHMSTIITPWRRKSSKDLEPVIVRGYIPPQPEPEPVVEPPSCITDLSIRPLTPSKNPPLELFDTAPLTKPQDIRILQLEPAESPSDPLSAWLRVGNLTACSSYDAVSYTRDYHVPSNPLLWPYVTVSGFLVYVSNNMLDCLRRLRLQDRPRRLWIDLFCINQRDADERSEQVAMMGGIYMTAEKVLVWLGEEQMSVDDGAFVFGLAEKLKCVESSEEGRQQYHRLAAAEYCEDLFFEEPKRMLERFMSRRYFHRRWVMSELYHAHAVEVYCEGYCTTWLNFVQTLDVLIGVLAPSVRKTHGKSSSVDVSGASDLPQYSQLSEGEPELRHRQISFLPAEVERLRNEMDGSGVHTIIPSMVGLAYLDCADARDRLYSLGSLWGMKAFEIDYSIGTETAYLLFGTNFVAACQRQSITNPVDQLLVVSAHQAGDVKRSHVKRLPTWVPDWRCRTPEQVDDVANSVSGFEVLDSRILRVSLGWYGIVDIPQKGVVRLELPQSAGLVDADKSGYSKYEPVLARFCPTLKDGDLLCQPVSFDLKTGSVMATVLRPTYGEHFAKYHIIGQFPLGLFGTRASASARMEVVIF